jgi:hypothetical protein
MSDEQKAKEPSGISKFFGELANKTSLAAGRASAFIGGGRNCHRMAAGGPGFGISDKCQLFFNTEQPVSPDQN